jgi:protein subunit release factor A
MKVLQARLYDLERTKIQQQRNQDRNSQVRNLKQTIQGLIDF